MSLHPGPSETRWIVCPNLPPGWRSNMGRSNNTPAYWTFPPGCQVSISSLTDGKAEPHTPASPWFSPSRQSHSSTSSKQKLWSHPRRLSCCHTSLPIPLQTLSFLSIKRIQNPATYYNLYNYRPGPSHCLLTHPLLGFHLISTQQPGWCCQNPPMGSQFQRKTSQSSPTTVPLSHFAPATLASLLFVKTPGTLPPQDLGTCCFCWLDSSSPRWPSNVTFQCGPP